MYEQFYGLRERPFSLTSHLKYLLLTAKHQEVLSNLEYGIAENPGMTLVVGQAGTGKTTLLRKVRDLLTPRAPVTAIRWVVMNNPILTPGEFFETLAHELELGPACAAAKSKFLRALDTTLLQQRAQASGITPDAARKQLMEKDGLRRIGQPEDVAEMALFLCTERARHIQGSAIAIDGGQTTGLF